MMNDWMNVTLNLVTQVLLFALLAMLLKSNREARDADARAADEVQRLRDRIVTLERDQRE